MGSARKARSPRPSPASAPDSPRPEQPGRKSTTASGAGHRGSGGGRVPVPAPQLPNLLNPLPRPHPHPSPARPAAATPTCAAAGTGSAGTEARACGRRAAERGAAGGVSWRLGLQGGDRLSTRRSLLRARAAQPRPPLAPDSPGRLPGPPPGGAAAPQPAPRSAPALRPCHPARWPRGWERGPRRHRPVAGGFPGFGLTCAQEVAGSWNSRPGAPGQGVKAGPESLAPCAPPRSHVPRCSLRGGHAGCPGRGRKKRPTLPLPRAGGRTFPVPGWGLRQRGCAEPAGGAPGLNL